MKVLVTAFEPFNNSLVNYSKETLKYIKNADTLVLDVIYDQCYQVLSSNDLSSYDLIIATGEARSRSELTLEVQAFNIASCRLPDNNGVVKKNEKIKDGNEVLKTTVDISKCTDIVTLSFDPGRFVCNNLYYYLLSDYPNKAIFIHIPNCEHESEYQKYAKQIEKIIEILS